jgi:hypothetical protein
MITISLTGKERLQFQYILPVQGSLETLELVDIILKKIKIEEAKETDLKELEVKFDKKEALFVLKMIDFLDNQKQLAFSSLSLIKKFLSKKGDCS